MSVEITALDRNVFASQHSHKTDKELQDMVIEYSRIIAGLPTSPTQLQIEQGHRFLAQMQLCIAELEKRDGLRKAEEKREKDIARAEEKWAEDLPARREAAFRNLKVASSANGQLVAAILENDSKIDTSWHENLSGSLDGTRAADRFEGGKTAQEIGTWCEELSAMPDEDLTALLTALEEEGVLRVILGKYCLRQLCTETLFPEHPAKWAMDSLAECYPPSILAELDGCEAVFVTLERAGSALTVDSLWRRIKRMQKLVEEDASMAALYPCYKTKFDEQALVLLLLKCTVFEVLKATTVGNQTLYYFPMLGEKEG